MTGESDGYSDHTPSPQMIAERAAKETRAAQITGRKQTFNDAAQIVSRISGLMDKVSQSVITSPSTRTSSAGAFPTLTSTNAGAMQPA
jgi:hypothetical protein